MKKRYYLFLLLGIITIYLLVLAGLAPVKKIRLLNAQYQDALNSEIKSKQMAKDPVYRNLRSSEAFLSSRLVMAKKDSICLVLDLVDSMVMLEISGVVLHRAKIEHMRGQGFFSRLEVPVITNLFGTPMHSVKTYASIPKEPIIIKKAPKDTTEASGPSKIPDTVDIETVCFSLVTDKGFIFEFRQTEKVADNKYRKHRRYKRNRQIGEIMKGALLFQVPEYRPAIVIRIPRADVKTIYRAISKKVQIAVRV